MNEATKIGQWAIALHKLARPYLTVLITTVYNIALLVCLCMNKLGVNDYILAVGPMNAMIIGFWFGERAAAKRQGTEPE